MPGGWKEGLAVLARVFRFQPSELWAMDFDEIEMWLDNAAWVREHENRRG